MQRLFSLVRAAFALSLAAGAASAATITWDSNGATAGTGGTGTWDLTAPVWNDGALTWDNTVNVSDTAVFEGTAGTVTLNNGGAAINALGLNFNVTGYTLASAAAGDTLNFGVSQGLIDSSVLGTGATTNGNLATISANLTGSAGLNIAANGNTATANGGGSTAMLNLTGTNTGLTGGIAINSGLVRFGSQNSAGTNTITLNGGGIISAAADYALTNAISIGANGGTLRAYGSRTLTLSGAVTGSGALSKTDAGTVLLSASTNGFTGALNIKAGTVRLGNPTANATIAWSASSVTVDSGATLSLNSSSGGNITVGYNFAGLSAPIAVNSGTLEFRQTNNAVQNLGAAVAFNGTSTVNLVASAFGGHTGALNGSLTGSGTLTFTASGGTARNFLLGNAANNFTGSAVLGNAAAATALNLSNPIGVADWSITDVDWTVNVSNTTHTMKSLASSVNAIITATGANARLDIGSGNTDTTYAGQLNGTLGITKSGTAALTLSGNSSFSGPTVINAGILVVNGNLTGSGAVTLNGGTLAGSGSLAGAATVNTATVSPGTATTIGTLSFNNGLVLSTNATLEFGLSPTDMTVGGTVNDLVNLSAGDFTLDGTLNLSPASGSFAGITTGSWRLFNYTGLFTNSILEVSSTSQALLDPGYSWSIDTSMPGQVHVSIVQAVPEPSTFVLAGIATLGYCGFRRHRRC